MRTILKLIIKNGELVQDGSERTIEGLTEAQYEYVHSIKLPVFDTAAETEEEPPFPLIGLFV